jgi:hypothetical protein
MKVNTTIDPWCFSDNAKISVCRQQLTKKATYLRIIFDEEYRSSANLSQLAFVYRPVKESRIIFTVRCRGGSRCTDDVAKFRCADGIASSVEIGAPSNKAVKLSDFLKRTVSPSRFADEDGRKGFLKELLQAFSNDRMIVHKEGLFLTYSVQTEAASKKPSSMSGRAE